MRECAFTNALN